MGTQPRADLLEQLGALACSDDVTPLSRSLRGARDGRVDLVGAGDVQRRENLLGGGVDDVEFVAGSGNLLTAYEQLGLHA